MTTITTRINPQHNNKIINDPKNNKNNNNYHNNMNKNNNTDKPLMERVPLAQWSSDTTTPFQYSM